MAVHKSVLKRERQDKIKRAVNRAKKMGLKATIKKLTRAPKAEADKQFPAVVSQLGKLSQKRVIHKTKAKRLQSRLAKQINKKAAK